VPRRLRERVTRTAGNCCGYCRTPASIAGFRLSIEHIIPEAKGGKTVEENLWLACHACNEFKAARVQVSGARSRHAKAYPLVEPATAEVARSFSLE
jgi:5-methylcytosine-specific restriction endonuclease McrA